MLSRSCCLQTLYALKACNKGSELPIRSPLAYDVCSEAEAPVSEAPAACIYERIAEVIRLAYCLEVIVADYPVILCNDRPAAPPDTVLLCLALHLPDMIRSVEVILV